MTIRDAVRTAIISTNAYPPFSSLNRVPYQVAIKAFIQSCKRYPEIESIYLRSEERNWIPGLSDIDLTVITDSRLTLAQEFAFLRTFWKGFSRLKQFFPMYGEIEILNDQNIATWTKFGLPGNAARNWKLVYGETTVPCNYQLEVRRFAIDSLNYSLHFMHWYYRSYFENKFVDRTESSYLLSKDLKRLASKILRCLAHFDQSEMQYENQDELFCGVIMKLERAVMQFVTNEHSSETGTEWADIFTCEFHEPTQSESLDIAPAATWTDALESIIVDFNNRFYFVLKNGADSATLKNCVQNAKRTIRHTDPSIVVLSACVFEYLIRYYEPFEYANLLRHRTVIFGKDLLLRIPPPTKDAFVDYLLNQIPNVLTYPQSREFGEPQEVELMLQRFLFLKQYVDHKTIVPIQQELRARCEQEYPEWFASLAFKTNQNKETTFKLFTLFRTTFPSS